MYPVEGSIATSDACAGLRSRRRSAERESASRAPPARSAPPLPASGATVVKIEKPRALRSDSEMSLAR